MYRARRASAGEALDSPKVSPIGTSALLVEAPGGFDLVQQSRIWDLSETVSRWPGVQEAVAGVTNLLIVFEEPPESMEPVAARAAEAWRAARPRTIAGRTHEVPVVYGGELGFDLPAIAARSGLSEREVIRVHASGDYVVCAVGSSPGFGYLHGLDPRIAMPRKSVPCLTMRAGSVTIGGLQAGIAVLTGPNGWNAIGWAPTPMFDPDGEVPCVLAPGDRIRFRVDRIEL